MPSFGKVNVFVKPSLEKIGEILGIPFACHIFSGLASYKGTHKAFVAAVKKGVFLGVMSEPFKTKGYKGKLRLVKNLLFMKRFGDQIDFIHSS